MYLVNTIENITVVDKNRNQDIIEFDSMNIFIITYSFLDNSY